MDVNKLLTPYHQSLLTSEGIKELSSKLGSTESYPGQRHSCLTSTREINSIADLIKRELSGSSRLSPFNDQEVRERLNPDSTSGYPDYTKQRDIINDRWSEYRQYCSKVVNYDSYPLTQYYRLQHRPSGVKLRSVMGYPMSLKCLEAVYSFPLQDWLRGQSFSAAGLSKSEQGQMVESFRSG